MLVRANRLAAKKVVKHLPFIAAYIVGFVFISVGMSKIIGHSDFVIVLKESPIVQDYVGLIAYPIPVAEVLIGLALFVPPLRLYAFPAAALLMIGFTMYSAYLAFFAPNVPCGCGGIFSYMSWRSHMYVNAVLTVLAIIGTVITWTNKLKSIPNTIVDPIR